MPQKFQTEIDDARKRTVRMVVRHLGANVATAIALTPDRLALMHPIATVDNAQAIAAALDAVAAASPQPSKQTNEQRWHLQFLDAKDAPILVVMSMISAPHYGYIGSETVAFADGSLVRFLSEHYAPLDVPSLQS